MAHKPLLSVIVCTYNRQEYVLKNLEALTLQKGITKDEFEVLLVNNNSPDNTAALVKEFIANHSETNIKYFLETNQGHTYARNRGINEASGDFLIFLDDDAFVRPDYCINLISFFKENPQADIMGGRIYPIYVNGKEPEWMTKYLLPLVVALDKGDQVVEYAQSKFPTGANMAFRKVVFEQCGLFNVELGRRGKGLEGGDEKDMILRAKKQGFRAFYAPFVIVDHIIPPHRVELEYIKGLALGVGRHERTRLKPEGFGRLFKKWLEEIIKIAGTLVLATMFSLKGQFSKSKMLIRFRYWVVKGLSGF